MNLRPLPLTPHLMRTHSLHLLSRGEWYLIGENIDEDVSDLALLIELSETVSKLG